MKLNKYLERKSIESIAILLSSCYKHSAYDIRNVILQLNSIDDSLIVLHESAKGDFSLNELVYMRLKGKDEQ